MQRRQIKKSRYASDSFTLIELLVVIAMIAITTRSSIRVKDLFMIHLSFMMSLLQIAAAFLTAKINFF